MIVYIKKNPPLRGFFSYIIIYFTLRFDNLLLYFYIKSYFKFFSIVISSGW